MYSRRDLLRSAALASAALPLASTDIFAQDDYPSRDFHAICMFPPGTGADIFVRFYGNKLQQISGKTVIVENKVGASATSRRNMSRSRSPTVTLSSLRRAVPFSLPPRACSSSSRSTR
jgi:tripartite-type tricarboxylate transporter receptor subunit TctC